MTPTLFTPDELRIRVNGRPAPQGSSIVREMPDGRRIPLGDSKYLRPWRKAVVEAARYSMDMSAGYIWPITDACALGAMVYLDRPPSNVDPFPTARWCGDLDKHLRSIFDALKIARVIADDSLIVRILPDTGMLWATAERQQGAAIRLSPLESQ